MNPETNKLALASEYLTAMLQFPTLQDRISDTTNRGVPDAEVIVGFPPVGAIHRLGSKKEHPMTVYAFSPRRDRAIFTRPQNIKKEDLSPAERAEADRLESDGTPGRIAKVGKLTLSDSDGRDRIFVHPGAGSYQDALALALAGQIALTFRPERKGDKVNSKPAELRTHLLKLTKDGTFVNKYPYSMLTNGDFVAWVEKQMDLAAKADEPIVPLCDFPTIILDAEVSVGNKNLIAVECDVKDPKGKKSHNIVRVARTVWAAVKPENKVCFLCGTPSMSEQDKAPSATVAEAPAPFANIVDPPVTVDLGHGPITAAA